MLNSIYFGLSLVAILLIVHWYILNDGKGQNDGTKGFLAIRRTRPKPAPKPPVGGKRSFRRNP